MKKSVVYVLAFLMTIALLAGCLNSSSKKEVPVLKMKSRFTQFNLLNLDLKNG